MMNQAEQITGQTQAEPRAAGGLTASTAYSDFSAISSWQPSSASYHLRYEIPRIVKFIHTDEYPPKNNISIKFKESYERLRLSKTNPAPLEVERTSRTYWEQVDYNRISGAFHIFLVKNWPKALHDDDMFLSLFLDPRIKNAIISRFATSTNISVADYIKVFDETIYHAFSKTWIEGFRLISDLYGPLSPEINRIVTKNYTNDQLSEAELSNHNMLLGIIRRRTEGLEVALETSQ